MPVLRAGGGRLTERILEGGESVATDFDGPLEPCRRDGVHGDVPAKAEQGKNGQDDGNGRESNLEGQETLFQLSRSNVRRRDSGMWAAYPAVGKRKTHKLVKCQLLGHAGAREESSDTAGDEAAGWQDIDGTRRAVVGRVVHEQEVEHEGDAVEDDTEPDGPAPVARGRGDKGADGWAQRIAHIEGEVEDGVGTAALVQEEQVDEASRAENADDRAEEAGEAARDDEEVELGVARHQRRPDGREKSAEQRPEHGGLTADDARDPIQDDTADNHAGQRRRVLHAGVSGDGCGGQLRIRNTCRAMLVVFTLYSWASGLTSSWVASEVVKPAKVDRLSTARDVYFSASDQFCSATGLISSRDASASATSIDSPGDRGGHRWAGARASQSCQASAWLSGPGPDHGRGPGCCRTSRASRRG